MLSSYLRAVARVGPWELSRRCVASSTRATTYKSRERMCIGRDDLVQMSRVVVATTMRQLPRHEYRAAIWCRFLHIVTLRFVVVMLVIEDFVYQSPMRNADAATLGLVSCASSCDSFSSKLEIVLPEL